MLYIADSRWSFRLEGKFGNGEDAYTTGKTRLKITSQAES